MNKLAILLALVIAFACTKPASDSDKSGGAPPAAGAVTRTQGSDPENGDFTLEEATKGLPGSGKLWATITTELGAIECELLDDVAPKTVASFVGLARGVRPWRDPKTNEWVTGMPFYDGLAFHRVIANFMIQGGDPKSRDYGRPDLGSGGPGFSLSDEVKDTVTFDRAGRLAMANSGSPTTGGSQFFITHGPKQSLDRPPSPGYVIFGQCGNEDVVKAIAAVPKSPRDKPDQPITMQIKISRR
jgi:peptidyl-prolyl cis-trans isomerase A (cyclophilin A)